MEGGSADEVQSTEEAKATDEVATEEEQHGQVEFGHERDRETRVALE